MYSIYSLIGGALGHIVLVLTSNIGDMLGWFYSICCGIVIQIICKDFIPEAINLDKSNGKQIFSIRNVSTLINNRNLVMSKPVHQDSNLRLRVKAFRQKTNFKTAKK